MYNGSIYTTSQNLNYPSSLYSQPPYRGSHAPYMNGDCVPPYTNGYGAFNEAFAVSNELVPSKLASTTSHMEYRSHSLPRWVISIDVLCLLSDSVNDWIKKVIYGSYVRYLVIGEIKFYI